MITVTYQLFCEARGCKEEVDVFGAQTYGADPILPEFWTSVRLNNCRSLIYCPKHLVSVDVRKRGKSFYVDKDR